MINQINSEHSDKIKALNSAHQKEIDELRANMGSASAAELERLRAEHAEAIKKLKQEHEKLIAQLNANFDK